MKRGVNVVVGKVRILDSPCLEDTCGGIACPECGICDCEYGDVCYCEGENNE